MKHLIRATAVAISVGIGVVAFGGVAHAWAESVSAHSACVEGATTITVSFTNAEPSTGDHGMVITATDDQSHQPAVWGNGQVEITVAGGQTVTGTIATGMVTAAAGTVHVTEKWANGSTDHDAVIADYGEQDCTPPPAPLAFSATTEGAGACDTTTGGSFIDWSVTNTGEIGLRAVATDSLGATSDALIAPDETLDMATLHRAGTFSLASYTVDVEATDGRTATVDGTLSPTLTGICTPVVPQTETPVTPTGAPTVLAETVSAPTAAQSVTPVAVEAASATLPHTGSSDVPLTIVGFGILGLGLLATGTTSGAARLRRFGIALSRVRVGR